MNNLHLALPEFVLLITACVALLGDLFLKRSFPHLSFAIACTGIVISLFFSCLFLGQPASLLFHGVFISDDIAHLMKIFIELTVLLSFVYSLDYINMCKMPLGDYIVLGLFATLGMMVVVSAHALLSLYLGIELLSLPLYALAAIQRSRADGAEAAIKYIVMGAIASALLLYGFSLLYGATGYIDFTGIATSLAKHEANNIGLLSFALVFIIAGIGFKLAAVPFHMWAPDVYSGAPTSVTLFLSAAPKIAAIAMTLRLLVFCLEGSSALWQPLLLTMALLSVGLGNVLALVQEDIKRLFAYSAISHMGYALFGIVAATTEGYASALYYVLVYSLMSVAAFGLLVLLSRLGLDVRSIGDLKGLNKRNPWLALLMMIILLSMAGIPPTVGFFIKLSVLQALVNVHLLWAAAIGLLFAVIGAFYYLKLIKTMYFEAPTNNTRIQLPSTVAVIFSVNSLALLYLGIFPAVLMTACLNAF